MAGGMMITHAECPKCGKLAAYGSTDAAIYPCWDCKRAVIEARWNAKGIKGQ